MSYKIIPMDKTDIICAVRFHLLSFHHVLFLPGALLNRIKFAKFCQDLTLLLLNTTCPVLANSEDPDQLASDCLSFNMRISIKNADQGF